MADKSVVVLSYVWMGLFADAVLHLAPPSLNPFRICVALAPEFLPGGKKNIVVGWGVGSLSLMAF